MFMKNTKFFKLLRLKKIIWLIVTAAEKVPTAAIKKNRKIAEQE